MSPRVDFRLPGDEDAARRGAAGGRGNAGRAASLLAGATFVLVAVLLALRLLGTGGRGTPAVAAPRPYDQADLARRLEDRGLERPAAEAWHRAAEDPGLEGAERARRLFRAGELFREAGEDERALTAYYESELVARIPEIAGEIDRARQECFRRLGNLSGLQAEIRARTALPGSEGEEGTVLAEIGSERITRARLDRRVEEVVEDRLHPLRRAMAPEQIAEQKRKILGQLQGASQRKKLLEDLVAEEVLYREAIERGLARDPDTAREFERVRREFFSRKLLDDELARRVSVSESDLRDFYQAHLDRYHVPESLRARAIVCEDETRAAQALAALGKGRTFEECVAEFSAAKDRDLTKGEIPGRIEKGKAIPGIGNDPALQAHLFALEEGGVSAGPVKSGDRFYLFQVLEKSPERVRPFEEVRDEVEGAKRSAEEREALEDLLGELKKKHGVVVYEGRVGQGAPPVSHGEPEKKAAGGGEGMR